jgi:hypothetical protein
MSKVIFKSMKLRYEYLIEMTKAYNQDDFAFLVFQPEIVDPKKNRDIYVLTAYIVDNIWNVKTPVSSADLEEDVASSHDHDIKLYLGNYPLSRKRIDEMIKGDPKGEKTVSLSLVPIAFSQNNKYISYKMTLILKDGGSLEYFAGDELQPSPPANAGGN